MTEKSAAPPPAWLKRHWGILVVAAVLILMACVRVRTRDFPLERDEGEYAYAGQLILQGIPPYQLAYNMKFPGCYAAYAVIMAIFGQTPSGIHLGVLCLTSLTTLMLYWLGRKLLNEITGVMAAVTCAILSASPSMYGLAGHATHFVAFFVTAGLCLLWSARQPQSGWKLFMGGLLFGLAVLMKQHAAIFCLWGLGVITFANLGQPPPVKLKSFALYGIGVVLPFALTCLVLWQAGVFPQFWFWTTTYASEYVSVVPLKIMPVMLRYGFVSAITRGSLFWTIAGFGLVVICLDPRWQKIRLGLLSLFAASFLTTCPGFFFRTHYFLVMIPALSLLAGCAVSSVGLWLQRKWPTFPPFLWPSLVFTLALAVSAFENRDIWFQMSPFTAIRGLYGTNPFPEAQAVANFIRTNSVPTDTVAVIGSEPEIYFLSHRHSATGYIYTYPLMEPQAFAHTMQEQMIQQIENARPRFVVLVECINSWQPTQLSDLTILDWWNHTYYTNYDMAGMAEILSFTQTRYTWGPDAAKKFAAAGGNSLFVYERKEPPPGR